MKMIIITGASAFWADDGLMLAASSFPNSLTRLIYLYMLRVNNQLSIESKREYKTRDIKKILLFIPAYRVCNELVA